MTGRELRELLQHARAIWNAPGRPTFDVTLHLSIKDADALMQHMAEWEYPPDDILDEIAESLEHRILAYLERYEPRM